MNDKPEQHAIDILLKDQLAKELSGKHSAIFETLERNAPQLSDAEIRKIADQVSRALIERELATLPPALPKKSKLRVKLIDLEH
jgi:hypothetical protein